jgi:hypothetical protein
VILLMGKSTWTRSVRRCRLYQRDFK